MRDIKNFKYLLFSLLLLSALTYSNDGYNKIPHKSTIYLGAGVYHEFPSGSKTNHFTGWDISVTYTNKLTGFFAVNSGIDICKVKKNNGNILIVKFFPSFCLEEDNFLLALGGGGLIAIGKGGLGTSFLAAFKGSYFFSNTLGASIEITSPISYDTHVPVIFSGGVSIVL